MIKILVIGKLDTGYWRDASDEYIKRINRYDQIEIIEIAEIVQYDQQKNIIEQTTKIINKLLSYKEYYQILLNINSQIFDSVMIANLMKKQKDFSNNKILFIIGGSYGVSHELGNKVDLKLSFGKITLPHQLCRIVLLEQIYRAFKINNNEKYHK